MAQKANEEIIKTTIRLPLSLHTQLRHAAIDEHCDLQTMFAKCVEHYLNTRRKKGGPR